VHRGHRNLTKISWGFRGFSPVCDTCASAARRSRIRACGRFETPGTLRISQAVTEGQKRGGGDGNQRQCRGLTLSKHYPVTGYDRELRRGGQSHTVSIDHDGAQLAVDIGFIVYNELNYPDLTALFAHLGVETIEGCMSFAVTRTPAASSGKAAAFSSSATSFPPARCPRRRP
jgi:hypothetical protein